MFYEPGKTDHGLPYDPFKACVVPRPIGWISTLSPTGQANLAPYSQFNNLTFDPPYVMFSANQTPDHTRKDSVNNAEATGVFCWNLATYDLRQEINKSAEQLDAEIDEFEKAGLEKVFSNVVGVKRKGEGEELKIPMVKRSPVRFECRYHSTIRLPGNNPTSGMGTADIVIGRVVGIHVEDEVITEGKVDVKKTRPIARLGYYEYGALGEIFEMKIPGEDKRLMAGLEGNAKKAEEAEMAESG